MAKTVALTVKVDEKEFQDFSAHFKELSDRVTGLTDKFNRVSQSIEKTAKKTDQIHSSMRGLLDVSKTFHRSIAGITKEFGKWGTLITGVVMTLGAGAGMWGIDRFSQRMMETRRQMLGLGTTDAAGMQTALRAGQITSATPGSTLQNIAAGLHGDTERMTQLRILGLYDPKKTPEQIYEKLLDRLDKLMQQAPKGRELPFLKPRLGGIMSDEDILRHIGPEGKAAREQERQQLKRKPTPIAPDALKAWTDLHQAYELFTQNLKNRIADRLAPVAKFLTDVAYGLTQVTTSISKWKTFQDAFNGLLDWAKNFYTWLYGEDFVKAWKNALGKLVDFAVDPKWDTIKNLMDSFVTVLHETINLIRSTVVEQIKSLLGRLLPDWIKNRLGLGGTPTGDGTAPAPTATPQGTTPQTTPPAPSQAPNLPPPKIDVVPGKQGAVGGGTQLAQWFPALGASAPSTSWQQGGNQFGSFRGGDTFGATRGGDVSVRAGDQMAIWSGAAQRAVPGPNVTGLAFRGGSSFAQMNYADNRRGQGRRGPLDIDNWQMNRTATLNVNSVPGSNIHMAGLAMSG
jgi:hypothetical protein